MEERNTISLSPKMWRKVLKFCAKTDFREYLKHVTVIPALHQIIASDGHALICICNTSLEEEKPRKIIDEIQLYDATNDRPVIAYKHRFIDPIEPWPLDNDAFWSIINELSSTTSIVTLDLNNKTCSCGNGQDHCVASQKSDCIKTRLSDLTNENLNKNPGIYDARGIVNMYKFLKCFIDGGRRIEPTYYETKVLHTFNFCDYFHHDNLLEGENLVAYFVMSRIVN